MLAAASPSMCSALLSVPYQEEPAFLLLPDFSREEVADFLTSLYHGLSLQPFTALTSTLGLADQVKDIPLKVEEQTVMLMPEKQLEDVNDFTPKKHLDEELVAEPQLNDKRPSGQKGVEKKKRSVVWEHFIKQDGIQGTVCICKHCSKEVTSHGGSTSAMTGHLKRHHSQVGLKVIQPCGIFTSFHSSFSFSGPQKA